ncbi:isochorismatase family protein [Kitasatospora sp. NPDC004745]|uniref:isochorismatase family protein n=1 Tax=Kitasatospora sp. NPDC004745 TaxID=3364019 RepID=UPI0036C450F6
MGLPRIPSYPMPAAEELPANRVAWTVDPARAVLLVHDLQNHFLDAFDTAAPPVTELFGNVARLAKLAAVHGMPVVYSAQPGGQSPAERGLQQDFWGPGIPDDPRATAIAEAVAPAPGDTVLTKWKYSAFVRTDLERLLREQGRDQLVITGVYAHIGVQATACDAWMRDVQAFVVADAVADFGPQEHRAALAWVAGRCGLVTTADAVSATLEGK